MVFPIFSVVGFPGQLDGSVSFIVVFRFSADIVIQFLFQLDDISAETTTNIVNGYFSLQY